MSYKDWIKGYCAKEGVSEMAIQNTIHALALDVNPGRFGSAEKWLESLGARYSRDTFSAVQAYWDEVLYRPAAPAEEVDPEEEQ